MTTIGQSADASFYYHEDANADFARMDSTAAYGNLADAMKNATLILPVAELSEIPLDDQKESERWSNEFPATPRLVE